MKVLWLVSVVMPDFAKHLKIEQTNAGGWLLGQLEALANTGIELSVCTVSDKVTSAQCAEINGVTYYVYPKNTNCKPEFESLLQKIKPDVIHIFGTEKAQSLALAQAANYKNCLVTIQGLVSECKYHYFDGMPEKYRKANIIKTICEFVFSKINLYPSIIATDYKRFCKNAEFEVELLKKNKNFSGRTHWDKSAVLKNNPNAQYFELNENLRAEFYGGDKWNTENMQAYRIFVSQANYPLKGFHMLLQSAAELKKTFPNLQIAVGGYAPIKTSNPLVAFGVNYFFEYQGYIKSLIKKYELQDNIIFLGSLSASQMKSEFLKANVFVSPSSIENSPNSVGEAMMLGTPVISSDVGGVSSMVTDEKEGLLYEFHDIQKLTSCITRIFNDKSFAITLSEKAMLRASQTHNRSKNTEVLIDIYKKISEQNL